MPRVKGELVSCCRCPTTIFLKYLGTDSFGFRDEDRFESLPREWMYQTQFGYLCPKCAKEFQTFCRDFFPGSLAPAWTNALDWEEK